jgi:AAA domain
MSATGVKSKGDWRGEKRNLAQFAEAMERSRAIRDGGYYEAFEAADARGDLATCDRIAAEVGCPYVPPLAASEGQRGGFTFTAVGDSLRAGLKPIQWLVRNYVEADSLALMFGDPGCGKSFAAIDLACCIATGTPWHANRTNPGAVFYIAGEGQNGLMRRFAAWSQHNDIPLSGVPLFVGHRPAQLVNAGAAAEVANAVEEMQAASGHKPALIVVDTLARNFGGDENSQEDMGAFIANLDNFLRKSGEWDATVLVVHHSGHADKARGRGSSALKGAVDAEYSLTKDESGVVRMEATKMKDAEQPAPVAFRLDPITIEGLLDDEGQPVTSAVLSSVAHVPPARNGKVGRGRNQTIALSVLADLVDEHRVRLAESGNSPDGARVTLDQWRDRLASKGIDRKRFYDLRNTLKAAGQIVVEFGDYVRLADEERPF